MAGISIHYDIRKATAGLIQAECGVPGLLVDLSPDNVLIRMMPKVGEIIDKLPCVIVAPVAGVPWEPLSFEDQVDRTYMVEFAIVAASNQDYLANQEKYEGWLEQIGRIVVGHPRWLLADTDPPCPSIWNTEIDHSATFDRSKLAINYAYQSVLGIYYSEEKRTGASYAG